MKKFAKLFLFAIVWLSLLWLSYAQDLWNPSSEHIVLWKQKLGCENMLQNIDTMFLVRILIVLLVLSICGILFHKKLNDANCNSKLLNIPVLNIYSLFKITIGKVRFYILMFNILFLAYIYLSNGWCFVNGNSFVDYIPVVWLVLWPVSLLILCWSFYALTRKSGWDIFISIIFAIFLPTWVIQLFSLLIWM